MQNVKKSKTVSGGRGGELSFKHCRVLSSVASVQRLSALRFLDVERRSRWSRYFDTPFSSLSIWTFICSV